MLINIHPKVFILSVAVNVINGQYVYNSSSPPIYCLNQVALCKYQGLAHFACNNNGQFASTCSADRDKVNMTDARIDFILDLHNSLRSKVAAGQLSGGLNGATLPPATRMATVRWSAELSDLALLNAKQCKMSHDACHNTAQFMFSGQNLGISSNNVKFSDPDVVMGGLINAWFNEYKAANASNIAKCCFTYSTWFEQLESGKSLIEISFQRHRTFPHIRPRPVDTCRLRHDEVHQGRQLENLPASLQLRKRQHQRLSSVPHRHHRIGVHAWNESRLSRLVRRWWTDQPQPILLEKSAINHSTI